MTKEQMKNSLDKAMEHLEKWKKQPLNICGDPNEWPKICEWIKLFLIDMVWEYK